MDAGMPPAEEAGYTGAAVGAAVLATLFFPFVALIAALLLQGGQRGARKKAQLRRWAWASGAWLAFGLVLTVLLAEVTLR